MVRPYVSVKLRGRRTGIRVGYWKFREDRVCHEYHFVEVRWV